MVIKKVKNFKRRHLGHLFAEKGFKKGVEVGVCSGKFSAALCRRMPGVELIGVDSYDVVELRAGRLGKERQEELLKEALDRNKKFNWRLIREDSLKAARMFPFNSLDFVYIDAGHEFDYVMCDIIEWGRRVKTGGIISGHDYYRFVDGGVIEAVNIFCQTHGVKNLYLSDEGPDRRSSWWFEKTWK